MSSSSVVVAIGRHAHTHTGRFSSASQRGVVVLPLSPPSPPLKAVIFTVWPAGYMYSSSTLDANKLNKRTQRQTDATGAIVRFLLLASTPLPRGSGSGKTTLTTRARRGSLKAACRTRQTNRTRRKPISPPRTYPTAAAFVPYNM